MAKKQTYAAMMKQLSNKKAKYEAGLEEAQRVGNRSGVADYQRRLQKLSAGMDELFQAQEMGKAPQMAKGGMTKKEAMYATGGPYDSNMDPMKFANGGETMRTVPADGNYPNAYINNEGHYIIVTDPTTGNELVMTNHMAQNLEDGVFGSMLMNGGYANEAPVYTQTDSNPNAATYGDIAEPLNPAGTQGPTSLEAAYNLSRQLNPELAKAVDGMAPPMQTFLNPMPEVNSDFLPAVGPAPVTTGVAGPMGARQMQQEFGKTFEDAGPSASINGGVGSSGTVKPTATAAAPAPKNYAGPQPTASDYVTPLGMRTFTNDIGAPTLQGVEGIQARAAEMAANGPVVSEADFGTKAGTAWQNFKSNFSGGEGGKGGWGQPLGMALGAAAQFLPDIAAMRAMDRIEGPVDTPQQRFQAQNTDMMVNNQLNMIDQEAARSTASIDSNVSNPAVAAAMKRASQRIAAGQKGNVLQQEAQTEASLRNQNLRMATENFNQNALIHAQNEQRQVDFRNEKLAAKNRMRQQMGQKLGGVFQDFQNRNMDMQRLDILSKQFDPGILARNGLTLEDIFKQMGRGTNTDNNVD